MKENNCQAYNIIGNKGLVSLATYKPETKEEFISLKGLGESTYSSFGKAFIDEIREYNRFGHSEWVLLPPEKQWSKCVGVYQSNKNRQLSVFIEFVVFVFPYAWMA